MQAVVANLYYVALFEDFSVFTTIRMIKSVK